MNIETNGEWVSTPPLGVERTSNGLICNDK